MIYTDARAAAPARHEPAHRSPLFGPATGSRHAQDTSRSLDMPQSENGSVALQVRMCLSSLGIFVCSSREIFRPQKPPGPTLELKVTLASTIFRLVTHLNIPLLLPKCHCQVQSSAPIGQRQGHLPVWKCFLRVQLAKKSCHCSVLRDRHDEAGAMRLLPKSQTALKTMRLSDSSRHGGKQARCVQHTPPFSPATPS